MRTGDRILTLPPKSGSHNEMHNLKFGRCYGKDKPYAAHAVIQFRSYHLSRCGANHSDYQNDFRAASQTLNDWLKAYRY